MNPEITDQTLVLQRLKEGDEKTFELLFHRYYATLCFFANKILKEQQEMSFRKCLFVSMRKAMIFQT